MMNSGEGRLRLRFSTLDPNSGGRRQVNQRATLAATRPGFGEELYCFVDDGRRAARLHLPPGAISSGCGSRQKRAANTARQRLIRTSDSNRYRAIHPDFNDR